MFQFQRKLLTVLFEVVQDAKEHFESFRSSDEMYCTSKDQLAEEFRGRTSSEYTKLANEHLKFQKDAEVTLKADMKDIGEAYRALGKTKDKEMLVRASVILNLLPDPINPLLDEEAKRSWQI